MLGVRASGSLRAVTQVKVRDGGGSLRTLASVKVRDAGNALRTVFSALSASASPSFVDGYGAQAGAPTIQTGSATVAPSGGAAPYAFAWSQTSGAAATITNPTGATTAFRFSGVGAGETRSATFSCTVTDANGVTAVVSVSASVENFGGGGGGPLP